MNKRILLIALTACLLVSMSAVRLLADDVTINLTFTNGVGVGVAQPVEHDDQAPFKGWALVNVVNDTSDYWTDFHFQVFSVKGSNITQTIFVDSPSQYLPTSSQTGLTWTINNDPAGATMDLVYASDPVAPGATAWFKVYTDNTTYQQKFGLSIYPTDDYEVTPEPGSMLAIMVGVVGLVGLARRRR